MKANYYYIHKLLISMSGCTLPFLQCFLIRIDYEKNHRENRVTAKISG
ncbi:hypothetical protein ADIS_1127 [Lunatimonas lonarensis]|uniref:Uncharacterized protein n=1 Tax=Lunatimonas lonarensis TaxID=1232681 RepID=R7ZW91_9BACT|nr:hypothetical protein ADIS_1127 [Lunatimonas lonarensis]